MKKAKKNEVKHDYKCDVCGKPATKNIQNTWHEYEITPKGDFNEVSDWEGDTNEFFCDNHN